MLSWAAEENRLFWINVRLLFLSCMQWDDITWLGCGNPVILAMLIIFIITTIISDSITITIINITVTEIIIHSWSDLLIWAGSCEMPTPLTSLTPSTPLLLTWTNKCTTLTNQFWSSNSSLWSSSDLNPTNPSHPLYPDQTNASLVSNFLIKFIPGGTLAKQMHCNGFHQNIPSNLSCYSLPVLEMGL